MYSILFHHTTTTFCCFGEAAVLHCWLVYSVEKLLSKITSISTVSVKMYVSTGPSKAIAILDVPKWVLRCSRGIQHRMARLVRHTKTQSYILIFLNGPRRLMSTVQVLWLFRKHIYPMPHRDYEHCDRSSRRRALELDSGDRNIILCIGIYQYCNILEWRRYSYSY